MKFHTLTLRGIRSFGERTIHFQDGLTIVCGPNESGKSTIVDSILYCITHDIDDVSGLIKWKTACSSIDLQYETDTREIYIINRTIFPEKKSKLENATIIEDPETISTLLKDHFGTTDRIILENSSVVKHNEMDTLRKMDSREIIKTQMGIAIAGDARRSAEDLLTILGTSIRSLEESLREVEFQREQCMGRLIPYSRTDEDYSRIENKIEIYQNDLEEYRRRNEIYAKRLLRSNLIQDIKGIQTRLEHIEDTESYIAAIPFDKVQEIEELQMELTRIEEDIKKKREEEKRRLQNDIQGEKKGIFAWLGSLFGKSRKIDVEERIFYSRDLYELERRSEDIRARKKDLISEVGSYRGKGIEYLNQAKITYQTRIEALLQGNTKEELVDAMSQKQQNADALRAAIFKTYPDLLDKDELEIQNEKERLQEKIEMLTREIENAQVELETLKTRKDEKDRIQRELNAINARKTDLETKKEVDAIILETIQSVYTDLKTLFIPQLEEKTGDILRRITRGKYRRILIERATMDIQVELPDHTVSIESLSQGTRDQLYFSLRIALSELLSGGKNLPLIFDEAFYTSDKTRLEDTFTVLKEIAQTTQVILFTHREDFLKYGNPILLEQKENVSRV